MPTDQQRIEDAGEGLSRRQVLARGAVAAGIVWAAPVIRSASAYATSAAGTERPCTKFYLVCVDVLGPRPVRFVDPEDGYDELPDADVIARFRTPEPAPTTTTTSSTSTTTTSSTSSTTTSSTSSTSTTSTTTTTTTTVPPFDDPTAGIGLFPDDEANEDPRATDKATSKKKAASKKKAKDKKRKTTATTDPELDANGAEEEDADEDPELDESSPLAPGTDGLGLFPAETDPADPAAAAPAAPAPDDLPPGIKDWLEDNPDVPVRYPEIPPMLTQSGEEAWALLLPEVTTGPDPANHQCRSVKGWAKSGEKHAEFYVDPTPFGQDDEGRRLIFPNPHADAEKPGAIDTVFLVYCCP